MLGHPRYQISAALPVELGYAVQKLEPVAVRHVDVTDEQIDRFAGQDRKRDLQRNRRFDFIAFEAEELDQRIENNPVVIDDKNTWACLSFSHHSLVTEKGERQNVKTSKCQNVKTSRSQNVRVSKRGSNPGVAFFLF